MGRLLASGFAHAVVLSAGVLVARGAWARRSTLLVIAGIAMQVQVAVGILGYQPSIRELEATLSRSPQARCCLLWRHATPR